MQFSLADAKVFHWEFYFEIVIYVIRYKSYKLYHNLYDIAYILYQITIQDPCLRPNVQFRKMLMHLFKFPCIKISSVVVRKTKLEIRATWAHLSLTLILPSFLRSEIILKSSNTVFKVHLRSKGVFVSGINGLKSGSRAKYFRKGSDGTRDQLEPIPFSESEKFGHLRPPWISALWVIFMIHRAWPEMG